jgi:chromate transporter
MNERANRRWEVFTAFARLGVTSFGGPVAHFGYFRREFVERRRWLDDSAFSELVALCSALPGPSSSQVGMLIGAIRAGPAGALLAWLAFTAPSALFLAAFGLALRTGSAAMPGPLAEIGPGVLAGLLAVAAAVVALAVGGLAKHLAATAARRAIAALAFALALGILYAAPQFQWTVLVFGGLLGALLIRDAPPLLPEDQRLLRVPSAAAAPAAAGLAAILAFALFAAPQDPSLRALATYLRAGTLVFGGGHVVLPFLQALVDETHVPSRIFLAGYGAAQAVPGPLFSFAAFLGAVDRTSARPAFDAALATVAIFAPSFLLLTFALPVWARARALPRAPAVLAGINASVVGLLATVFVDPIGRRLWETRDWRSLAVAIAAAAVLARAKAPVWAVVLASALAGAVLLH